MFLWPAIGLLASSTTAFAEIDPTADFVPYQVTRETVVYTHLPDTAMEATPGLGDGGSLRIDLPFDFFLFGVPHRTIYVNANGFIAMTAPNEQAQIHVPPAKAPYAAAPAGFVAPLWADWCASATESGQCSASGQVHPGVFYLFGGDAGHRSLRVEWRGVRLYQHDEVPGSADFSATLHEGLASQIDFDYGDFVPGEGAYGTGDFAARIGVESADEQVGFWMSPCAGYAACSESEVASLSGQRIRLVADAGPDVGIDTVAFDPVMYPGTVSRFDVNLTNRHGEPTSSLDLTVAWTTAMAASDGNTRSDAVLEQRITVSQLGAFESRQDTIPLSVPFDLPPGRYRVTVRADDVDAALRDVYDANNECTALEEVSVVEARADFRVVHVALSGGLPRASRMIPSTSFELDFVVENQGFIDGAMDLVAVVSSNRSITMADRPIGELRPFDVKRGARAGGTLRVTLPDDLEPGDYYVGLLVNTGLITPEIDVANNVGRSPDMITVWTEDVAFEGRTLPPGVVGRAERWSLHAVGGAGVFLYAVVDGTLPPGLLLSPDGAIEGTPEREGTYAFAVRAVGEGDGLGRIARFGLTIDAQTMPLAIAMRQLPAAVVGRAFETSIAVAGGQLPYQFEASSAMPPGLTLRDDGVVQGVPTVSGAWSFDVAVTDAVGERALATLHLDVRYVGALLIVSSDLGEAMLGEPISAVLHAEGQGSHVQWRALDAAAAERQMFDVTPDALDEQGVPKGLVLSSDGRLYGVPSESGSARFVVEARDDEGHVDRALVWITILQDAVFRFDASVLPTGLAGSHYRAVVTTSGGEPPITWRVVDDHKPPGMTLRAESEEGFVVEGPLERQGVWSVTLEARDARGRSRVQPFAILVSEAPKTGDDRLSSSEGEGAPVHASCRCVVASSQDRGLRDTVHAPSLAPGLASGLASGSPSAPGPAWDGLWGWIILSLCFVFHQCRRRRVDRGSAWPGEEE